MPCLMYCLNHLVSVILSELGVLPRTGSVDNTSIASAITQTVVQLITVSCTAPWFPDRDAVLLADHTKGTTVKVCLLQVILS